MKVYDIAMSLVNPEQKVVLKDGKSRRICFEGNADQLLDYSGIDYRKVRDIAIKDNILILYIK